MITEQEIIDKIHATVVDLAQTTGFVSLGHHVFDRMPCTKRKVYAIAQKYAEKWGYEYRNGGYQASGNPAFKRNHKRGYSFPPSLQKQITKGV